MKKINKHDKKILRIYENLPFPRAFYEFDELDYLTSLDSMKHGYCDTLLHGQKFKFEMCEEEELLIENEFRKIIDDKKDLHDIYRYYYMHKLVCLILIKYND